MEDYDLLWSFKKILTILDVFLFFPPQFLFYYVEYTHVQTRKRIMTIVHLVPVLQIFLVQVNLLGSIRVFAWLKIYTTYWRNAYDVVIWYSNTRFFVFFFFPDKTESSYCEPVLYTRQYLGRGGIPKSVLCFHEWCNCGFLGSHHLSSVHKPHTVLLSGCSCHSLKKKGLTEWLVSSTLSDQLEDYCRASFHSGRCLSYSF